MKIKKKIKNIVLFIIIFLLISCKYNLKESNHNKTNVATQSIEYINSEINYKYYDVLNISPAKMIVPKNQTISQSLSILVNDGEGNLIVFDGGRIEDADYLCDIIKENGGVVTTWFITHIHDDHIGALYEILNKQRIDIRIKELVYNFADFEWYYSKMGNDAGAYYLFESALKEYNDFLSKNNFYEINVINSSKISNNKHFSYTNVLKASSNKYKNSSVTMEVDVLNDLYKFDKDPINNSSIVYCVVLNNKNYNIEHKMIIFGDLGFEGGNELFFSLNHKYYDADILVLAHHGQNGIDPILYKKFNPMLVIWPTSNDIFANTHGRYYTNDTKTILSEIKSIKYQIKSFEETALIR